MTIAVNGANEKRNNNSILPVLTGVAGAGTGGYLIGEAFSSKNALKYDELKLSKKAQEAFKTTSQQGYDDIASAIKSANTEAVNAKVTTLIGEATEIDIAKYIDKLDDFKAGVEANKAQTESLITAVKNAADKPAKKTAQAILDSHITKIYANESLLNSIKDGKVSKEALADHIKSGLKSEAASKIDDVLKSIKDKLPKVFSAKNAVIGAVAGLALGWIITRSKD